MKCSVSLKFTEHCFFRVKMKKARTKNQSEQILWQAEHANEISANLSSSHRIFLLKKVLFFALNPCCSSLSCRSTLVIKTFFYEFILVLAGCGPLKSSLIPSFPRGQDYRTQFFSDRPTEKVSIIAGGKTPEEGSGTRLKRIFLSLMAGWTKNSLRMRMS
jgi:hypothetical protein